MSDDRNKWGERPKPITLESVMAVYESEVAALREERDRATKEADRYCAALDKMIRDEAALRERAARAEENHKATHDGAMLAANEWERRLAAAEARASLLEGALREIARASAADVPPGTRISRMARLARRALPPTRGGGNEGRGTT
jgi:Na+-translocating ferredoxin:NAD+ oxidoreductase RnfC subunit